MFPICFTYFSFWYFNTTFICFTETDKNNSKTWKNIDIKPFLKVKEFKNDINLLKEFIKLHPNYFFSNFKNSMWVDFDYVNMIPFNIQEFIKMMNKDTKFLTLKDKNFDCSWKYLIDKFHEEDLFDMFSKRKEYFGGEKENLKIHHLILKFYHYIDFIIFHQT